MGLVTTALPIPKLTQRYVEDDGTPTDYYVLYNPITKRNVVLPIPGTGLYETSTLDEIGMGAQRIAKKMGWMAGAVATGTAASALNNAGEAIGNVAEAVGTGVDEVAHNLGASRSQRDRFGGSLLDILGGAAKVGGKVVSAVAKPLGRIASTPFEEIHNALTVKRMKDDAEDRLESMKRAMEGNNLTDKELDVIRSQVSANAFSKEYDRINLMDKIKNQMLRNRGSGTFK